MRDFIRVTRVHTPGRIPKMLRLALGAVTLTGFLSCAGTTGVGQPGPVGTVLGFYTEELDHLSAVRAGNCPMYPSCSEYSKACFQRYGFLRGWMMTCDRLMRCGRDEIRWAPRVYVNGEWKYFDPVERNVRWWTAQQGMKGATNRGPGAESSPK
jgi:hypothetical protein